MALMSEKFSTTLRIGDLNEYIPPSQGCVIKTEIAGKSRMAPEAAQTEPVKISLKDCLACRHSRSQSCPFGRDSLKRVNSGGLWVYTSNYDKLPLILPDATVYN